MIRTKQQHLFASANPAPSSTPFITTGTVVDTNDPQQMGRCRVYCAALGDLPANSVENLPWALYVSPIAGHTYTTTRGPGIQQSEGSVGYGMWAIPKVGSQVVVFCLDGDYTRRAFFGGMFSQFTAHTLPHGRWMSDDHPGLEQPQGADPAPHGPYTSSEKLIEPTNTNMREAFGSRDVNYEWRTRAADYTVSRVDVDVLDRTYSKVQDDKDVKLGDWVSTQGYQTSRVDPLNTSPVTDRNYDSQVMSLTSPGFHAISMDDRQENCRIRLRTTSGHQIILDDTNERIYISTAKGNNWVEMDQAGNIDMYTTNKVSIHAAKDINLTADDTIRLHAGKGIHCYSGGEFVTESVKATSIKSHDVLKVESAKETTVQAGSVYHIKASAGINMTSGKRVYMDSASSPAAPAATLKAMWTNKVPDHEPYARVMTKDDYTHAPEYEYDDKNVGLFERGIRMIRGMFWRR